MEILPVPGSITTSLIVEAWASCLEAHQNRGIPIGRYEVFMLATIGLFNPRKPAKCNMPSIYEHPEVIDKYIQKELNLGRMAGSGHKQI